MRPLVLVDEGRLKQQVRCLCVSGATFTTWAPLSGDGTVPAIITYDIPEAMRRAKAQQGYCYGERWIFGRVGSQVDGQGRLIYLGGHDPTGGQTVLEAVGIEYVAG